MDADNDPCVTILPKEQVIGLSVRLFFHFRHFFLPSRCTTSFVRRSHCLARSIRLRSHLFPITAANPIPLYDPKIYFFHISYSLSITIPVRATLPRAVISPQGSGSKPCLSPLPFPIPPSFRNKCKSSITDMVFPTASSPPSRASSLHSLCSSSWRSSYETTCAMSGTPHQEANGSSFAHTWTHICCPS